MKRVISGLLICVLCLSFGGCDKNGKDPLSLYLDGKEILTLGMNKDEIENILVPNNNFNSNVGMDETEKRHEKTYENIITVFY